MSSFTVVSSGSEGEPQNMVMDEKKRKRMISNRESARRSRMKKQKQMTDLVNEKGMLERIICESRKKYNAMKQDCLNLESENTILMSEKMQLKSYLEFLQMIIHNSMQVSKCPNYVHESSDFSMKSWQMPDCSQHIVSTGVYQF